MNKRFVSLCLITILTLCSIPVMDITAATTKTAKETVTGAEVLEYVTENILEADEIEQTIAIQTYKFSTLRDFGYKAAVFGRLITNNGKEGGTLPLLVTKKRPQNRSYKYITAQQPSLYIVNITNTTLRKNVEYGIFQKDQERELDAFEKENCYYCQQVEDVFDNVSCLTEPDNYLKIKDDAVFYKYDLCDSEDEVVGVLFMEKNTNTPPKVEEPKDVLWIGDSRTVCMFSAGNDNINGQKFGNITVYGGWGLGIEFTKESLAAAGDNWETLVLTMGCNDAAQGQSFNSTYAPVLEELLAKGKKIILFGPGYIDESHLASVDVGKYTNANMQAWIAEELAWSAGKANLTFIDTTTPSKNWPLLESDGLHYVERPANTVLNWHKQYIH